MKNLLTASAWICAMLVSAASHAKMVEYYEDAYSQQAPQELLAQVERVVQEIGYEKDYQVIIPKKAGIQLNPLNKMTTYGINPQNKTPFILVNPEWFSTLTQDQQNFLIARNLTTLQESSWFNLVTLFPWIWMIMSFVLMILAYFALNRTRFGSKPTWMKILAVYVVFTIANFTLGNALFTRMHSMVGRRFDAQMVHKVLEKMGQDKQVAISTFQAMDTFAKKELAEGDTFWKPYENTFADLVERLK